MAKGPEETRLDSWLDGSHEAVVDNGGEAWSKAAILLSHVQGSIEQAAARAALLGGETGPAAARAFARSAEAMGKKAGELQAGGDALAMTARAVAIARQQRREMGPPPNEPVAPEPPAPGAPPTDKDLEKQAAYRSSVAAYQHDQQQREARSKAITSDMDVQYRSATETMKKIHGEPDPVHKTSTTNGSGGGSGTPAGSGGQGRTATPTTYDGSSSPSGTAGHSPGLVTSGPGHAPASSTSAPPATHGSTTAPPGRQRPEHVVGVRAGRRRARRAVDRDVRDDGAGELGGSRRRHHRRRRPHGRPRGRRSRWQPDRWRAGRDHARLLVVCHWCPPHRLRRQVRGLGDPRSRHHDGRHRQHRRRLQPLSRSVREQQSRDRWGPRRVHGRHRARRRPQP